MPLKVNGWTVDAADPYPVYRLLQQNHPVARAESGVWVVTRYSDAATLLTDTRFAHWQLPIESSSFERLMNRWMASMEHRGSDSVRHALMALLSPERLAAAAHDAARTAEIRLSSNRQVDAIDVAHEFTLSIAAQILGVPEEEKESFVALVRSTRPLFATIGSAHDSPAGELASRLRELPVRSVNGTSDEEVVAYTTFLLFAAHDNMVNFIGNSLLALLRDDATMRRLSRDPHLWPGAIDELLRFDSPVQFISLLAREAVEVSGQRVERNDVVWVGVGAANRDPLRFSDPDRLVIDRKDNPHLSFGIGAMRCVGAQLARLEGRLLLDLLLRLENPRVEMGLQWRAGPAVLRGLESLPVAYDDMRTMQPVTRIRGEL